MNQKSKSSVSNLGPWLAIGLLAAASHAHAATFLGIAYPHKDVTLSVESPGVVQSAEVKVGESVKAQQVLLKLASGPKQWEVQRRQVIAADRSQIENGAERLKLLQAMVADADKLQRAGGVISQDEVRKLQLELVTAQAEYQASLAEKKRQEVELSLALAERDQFVLRAPLAGVITDFLLSPGEWAAPGEPVARLVDTSQCEVRIKVSAKVASRLKSGQIFTLDIQDANGSFPVPGKVTFVSPVSDAASSLVDVRLLVSNRDLRIRAGTKVSWSLGSDK
jgi:RND family efflux transporter MFP subunit